MTSNRSRPRRRRRILVAATSAVAVALAAATVAATNFGPQGDCGDGRCCVCYADGTRHTLWQPNLGEAFENAFDWARREIYAPTDLRVPKVDTHGASDVAAYQDDYGDTKWFGIVDCIDYVNDNVCSHWHLHVNSSYGPYTRHQRRVLACHEFGHTVGLQHVNDDDSCMDNNGALGSERARLRDHDIRHINRRYD